MVTSTAIRNGHHPATKDVGAHSPLSFVQHRGAPPPGQAPSTGPGHRLRKARGAGQDRPFTLTLDLARPSLTLSLRQTRRSSSAGRSTANDGNGQSASTRRLVALEGRRARLLQPVVLEELHKQGFFLAHLEEKGSWRVRLTEAAGARLALLLWALDPVQKPSRAALIQAGIAAMSDEEVYYWYAKSEGNLPPGGQQQRNNALKALRILLAGE
jgi:hypothetical protein